MVTIAGGKDYLAKLLTELPEEYECPICGARSYLRKDTCRLCGAALRELTWTYMALGENKVGPVQRVVNGPEEIIWAETYSCSSRSG
jgi:ribosomal protein L37E